MSHTTLEHFRKLLGIPNSEPSYDALKYAVTSYITRVPFENISKLYYKDDPSVDGVPSLEKYVEGIEKYHFGGTCYVNNPHMFQLLRHLGYDVRLCGADMENPDVHIVCIVTIDGREYLVDSGYAAPFLEPLPRDLNEDVAIINGHDCYYLRPQDENGHSRMDLYRDGEPFHGYTAKPTGRDVSFFSDTIAHSFSDEATFMNSLLLVRFYPGQSVRIHNLEVTESEGAESKVTELSGLDELPGAIEEIFQIPREISRKAISGLSELGNPWS
jgi:arylamine N-acetyltransferase